jgi:hypothetical protein
MTTVEPRLRIELVPAALWYGNLRKVLSEREWKRLRRWALDRAGDACEVCGDHAEGGKNLVCHEQWTYDDQTAVQTLVGVEIHCRDCDGATHIGHTQSHTGLLGLGRALRQLADVNGVDASRGDGAFSGSTGNVRTASWAELVTEYRLVSAVARGSPRLTGADLTSG